MLPAFSLHAGFNFELGVPWSKVSDTREKGACVATCCKGLKVQILSPLSLIVTEFFRISSQSNACPLLDLTPSLSLWTSRRSNMSPPIIKWATTRDKRRSAASRTFSIESRFSDYDESLHGLEGESILKYHTKRLLQRFSIMQFVSLAGTTNRAGIWQGTTFFVFEEHHNADWQPRCAPITSLCLPLPPLSPPKF